MLKVRILLPVMALLFLGSLFLSCGPAVEDVLKGATRTGASRTIAELGKFGIKDLQQALTRRVNASRFSKDPQIRRGAALLIEAMLRVPGGRRPVLRICLDLKRRKRFTGEVWRAFSRIAERHREWLLASLRGTVKPEYAPLKPDLLAAAVVRGGREGETLFSGMVRDYSLEPALFLRAFEVMPLKRFCRFADLSRPELRALGIRRLKALHDPAKPVPAELKRLAAAGYPVLAVFLAEELTRPRFARYRDRNTAPAERKKIRRFAMRIYWFLTGLRSVFRDRSEDEQRAYAAIVKIAYDVQSGQ